MPHPLCAEAVARAAARRGWLDPGAIERLIVSLAGIEREGLSAALRQAGADLTATHLADLLPPIGHPGFGRWQALARLGGGAMGVVWLAAATEGPLVVVKTALSTSRAPLLSGESGGSVWTGVQEDAGRGQEGELQLRFAREARITAGLAHPRIVPCLDGGVASDGTRYLVLAWVSEGDLAGEIARHGALRPAAALSVADQIADALDHAHNRGVIHRDLKPANIFVRDDGSILLGDFGLARPTSAGATRLTMAGVAVGTPNAMAPEQIDGRDAIDGRADLYALGCLMFVCLAGRPPFSGRSAEVMQAHRTAPPPDLAACTSGLPDGIAQLVARLMQKRPEDRPDSAASVRAALVPLLTASGVEPGVPARLREREQPPAVEPGGDDLLLHGPDGDPSIVLWSRRRIVLGKQRAADVDLVVRDYPEDVHRARISRVSRRHAAISADKDGVVQVEDLGSSNGTSIDGKRLAAKTPHVITAPADVTLAGVAGLTIRPSNGSVVLTRTGNRPGLTYAMVPQRLRLGADGDLSVPGATLTILIERRDDRWLGDGKPLPDELELGGVRLLVRPLGDFL